MQNAKFKMQTVTLATFSQESVETAATVLNCDDVYTSGRAQT